MERNKPKLERNKTVLFFVHDSKAQAIEDHHQLNITQLRDGEFPPNETITNTDNELKDSKTQSEERREPANELLDAPVKDTERSPDTTPPQLSTKINSMEKTVLPEQASSKAVSYTHLRAHET